MDNLQNNLFIITDQCSHLRATEYFAESILNPSAFVGTECPIGDILTIRKCPPSDGDKVIMGEYTPRE